MIENKALESDKLPLVSVPVITYNSSAYILDGLESIKAQTYKNIELIISDDCSTDNTVEICRQWLEENKDRFVRTLLVTSDKNTGVAGNCNRSVAPCQGEWIKGLSGDDRFLPHTIQRYVDFVLKHPEADICAAKLKLFGEDQFLLADAERFYESICYTNLKKDLHHQQTTILKTLFVPGPCLFYKKKLWSEIGGFDEKYQFCEEYPFSLRVLYNENQIFFLNEELYGYHIRSNSLCREKKGLNYRVQRDLDNYTLDERIPLLISEKKYFTAFDLYITVKRRISSMDKSFSRHWYNALRYISPLRYINRISGLF